MKRVMDKNDQHETRSTTQILKGIKDIPEQFFNTPAARKQQSRQQILPWKCSDEQKEDKELENALMKDNQETHIIEYVTQHGLVPDKKNMSIEKNLESPPGFLGPQAPPEGLDSARAAGTF